MSTRVEFVPEPFASQGEECWAPRHVGQRRIPAADEQDLSFYAGEARFKRGWVRAVEPDDLSDEMPCVCGEPGRLPCGQCGCFIICSSRDPRRAQPVWWLP